ncbi:peptidoglycan-binding protein [uncultured Roseovarius sp.]|uniref:peptidoglycan-binding protein n=1 Tax=uncultured Roseovarius sp. TaxID=293344 RepID=UPI0025D87521|nr:peptidoglycan-binding protein [uncultured Roseovarius sp.]
MKRNTIKLVLFFTLAATPGYSFDLNDVVTGINVINELSKQQQERQPQRDRAEPRTEQRQQVQSDRRTIRQIQTTLTDLGYAPGPIDGLMGSRTAQAIRRFEADIGAPVTGQPTRSILRRMQAERQAGGTTPTASNTPNPSFDCARAGTSTEKAICSSASLATYDREIARSFSTARDRLDASAADDLLQGQRAWLRERNACGGNRACLESTMRDRAAYLQRVTTDGSTNRVANSDTMPGASGAQGNLPLFFISNDFVPRSASSRYENSRDDMVTRLEYAANADLINDTDFMMRLLDTLPDEDIDALIGLVHEGNPPQILLNNLAAKRKAGGPTLASISTYLWENEFDRRLFMSEGRALVEARIAQDQLAGSIDVMLICAASFGEYDFDAEEFPQRTTSCREKRLDLNGRSVLAEYRSGPGIGPISMEVSEARAFSDQLGSLRKLLVSSPATLSIEPNDSMNRLSIEVTGPPRLHPMHSLEEVLYTYPETPTADAGDAGQPSYAPPVSDIWPRVPGAFFVLRLAPDVLTEDEWLQLTERQVQYDQDRNGPSVFSPDQVRGRKPSFVAPELVDDYKAEVQRLLSDLTPRAVTPIKVEPEWVGYKDGKLTASRTNGGYLREIHRMDRMQNMAEHLGKSAAFGDPGLQQDFNVKELPESLVQGLRPLIRNVILVSDRLPRIPALEMEAAKAESLFLQDNCHSERDALNDLMQDGSGASAYDVNNANETYYDCLGRKRDLPEHFVFDISMEFTGVQRNERGFFLETKLLGAELYDLKGLNFASLTHEDFPAGDTGDNQKQDQAEQEQVDQAEPEAESDDAPTLIDPDIVGLKLGMSLDEADKVIRSHFEKIDGIVERHMAKNVFANSIAYGNASTGESIAVYHLVDRPEEGVIAITRTLDLPGKRPMAGEFRKLISEKYGLEDSNWGNHLQVNDTGHRNCLPLFPTSLGRYLPSGLSETWRQGSRADVGWELFSNVLSLPFPQGEVGRRMILEEADCVPALAVRFFSTNDDLSIHTLLVDASAPREVMREALTAEKDDITTKF